MKYSILFLAFLTSGCASQKVIYNPSGVSSQELVKVVTKHKGFMQGNFFKNEYNAWIVSIHNLAGDEVTNLDPAWDRLLGEVTLPPGEYVFGVKCTNGYSEGYPVAKFSLSTGKHYMLFCEIGKEKGLMGIKFDSSAIIKIIEIDSPLQNVMVNKHRTKN